MTRSQVLPDFPQLISTQSLRWSFLNSSRPRSQRSIFLRRCAGSQKLSNIMRWRITARAVSAMCGYFLDGVLQRRRIIPQITPCRIKHPGQIYRTINIFARRSALPESRTTV